MLEIGQVLEVYVKDLLHCKREVILPKKKDAVATPEGDVEDKNKAENPISGMLNFTDEGDEG